ncbi:MAG: hypothetical protein L0229_21680 [Blastocatellia bacterium]|nr:hypothetical protein [Blastocatellia bacterium]
MLVAHRIAETATRTIEDSKIAGTRLVLASAALLIFYLDPAEPNYHLSLTYGALILYALYSAIIYRLTLSRSTFLQYIRQWSHWIDVGWYLVLIALSSGTGSIFFFFFFFSILVASFRWGFWPGLRVVIVSAILFTAVGYILRAG